MKRLLAGWPVVLLSLSDIGRFGDVEETGSTFMENAVLKATGYAPQAGITTLADDSGLEVFELDKRPGVFSARYGGDDLDFNGKMSKLLGEMQDVGASTRRARFVCSIAIANAGGEILRTAEGICAGRIAMSARGRGGFGYDPLFIPDGFENTFGELSDAVKQQISHRSRAFEQIIPFLRDLMAVGLDLGAT